MKLMLWSVVAAIVVAASCPVQAVVLPYFDDPIEDATVDSVETLANYGAEPTLRIQGSADSPPLYSLGSVKRIYLKFDISVIPDDAQILSAEFGIYFAQGNQGGASTVDPHAALYLVSDDSWQEMSVNWENRPAYEPGYVEDEQPLAKIGTYYKWNLLSTLGENTWTNHAGDLADNYLTVMLMVPDEEYNNYAIFNSDEASTNQPYLSITYTPEPATLLLLGLGGMFLLKRR